MYTFKLHSFRIFGAGIYVNLHFIFLLVVQMWGKKTEKPSQNVLCEGFLYPEPGSNRHGLLHWCLRPARLPIPPSGLVAALFVPFRDFGSVVAVLIGRQHRRVDLLVKVCKDIANCLNYQLFCN